MHPQHDTMSLTGLSTSAVWLDGDAGLAHSVLLALWAAANEGSQTRVQTASAQPCQWLQWGLGMEGMAAVAQC